MLGQPLDNPESYLGRVGVLVECPAFSPALTGAEHLAVLATIAGHEQSQIPLLLKLGWNSPRAETIASAAPI